MYGMAFAFLLDCWLEHPPFIGDVLGVFASIGATVVLNSIEWDVIVSANEQVHQQVIMVMLICYSCIFFQGGIVIWHLVQAPSHSSHWADECHEACCAAVEGYYCLLVLTGCSLLRFAVPLDNLQGGGYSSNYNHVNGGNIPEMTKGGSIGVSVTAALLMCVGMLCQLFATFGKFGTDSAIFALAPIVILMPMVLITLVKAEQSTTRYSTWQAWSCFVPSLLYIFSACWPFVLHHRRFIDNVQLALCCTSVLCFLIASKCLVCIVGRKVHSTHQVKWNFGF